MRTPIEALKEIRDRLTYFCLRTDGKYNPPWATDLVGIIDEAVTACHAVGNAAAMREALLEARRFVYTSAHRTDRDLLVTDGPESYVLRPIDTLAKMDAALALPRRQCDVGTAEEQYARWRRFCDSQKCCNNQCPVYKLADVCESKTRCNLIWAQMPYEEGGDK